MNNELYEKCNKLIGTMSKDDILIYDEILEIVPDSTDEETINKIISLFEHNGIVVVRPDAIEDIDEDIREIDLSVQEYDAVKIYMNSIEQRLLTIEEEKELSDAAKNGDINARNKLVNHNLKLVISIAKRYSRLTRSLDFLDVIQAGNLGLMRSIDKYNPDLGYKFSTYASWWIRQSIIRTIADEDRNIRLPVHMIETIGYIKRAKRELKENLNRDPSYDEIAKYMNDNHLIVGKTVMSEEKVKTCDIYSNKGDTVSIFTPIGDEDDDSILGDFIPDVDQNVEDKTAATILAGACNELLDVYLKPREAEVLRKRFGFGGYPPMTLEEIASGYGLTRERIRQIEAKAKRKFKRYFEQHYGSVDYFKI